MRILLKDKQIKTLQITGHDKNSGKKPEWQIALQTMATKAYQVWATDKKIQFHLDNVGIVGAFFPEDFQEQAAKWNSEIGEYCEKMLDYVCAGIKGKPNFWLLNPEDATERYQLLRLATLVGNQWMDHSRYAKLGFDNGLPLLSETELQEIIGDPSAYAILDGTLM